MNKKIIAVLLIATVLFACVFAACNKSEKEEGVYVKNDDINFVTDENGDKVLDSDGRIIVYATDEDGKKIKDDNGEYVTQAQEFQPIEDDGVIEDLGFFFELPDGWKSTDDFGKFENKKDGQHLEITIIKQAYVDYYNSNLTMYKDLKAVVGEESVKWEEDVDFGDEFKGLCRFTLKTEEGISVMYFFENSKNLYKVLFTSEKVENAVADSEEIIKALSFKPYAYYTDITTKPVTTTETTAAPLTKPIAD